MQFCIVALPFTWFLLYFSRITTSRSVRLTLFLGVLSRINYSEQITSPHEAVVEAIFTSTCSCAVAI